MKRTSWIILGIIVIILVIGGGWYHHNYSPIYYYGQVGNLERKENSPGGNPDVYYYKIKAYNEQGDKKTLEVGSVDGHKFTKGHYIRIGYSRAKNVADYKGISYSQVPKEPKQKLSQQLD